MLKFNLLTLEDKDWITDYYRKKDVSAANFSFASNYIWAVAYPVEVCEDDGFLFLKTKIGEKYSFICPVGNGDLKKPIEKIKEYCLENNIEFRLYGILEEDKEKVERILGEGFSLKGNRDTAEYIYERDVIAELKGKKYHGKRNHIRRFMDCEWQYEAINEENIKECLEMQIEWCHKNNCDEDASKIDESCAAIRALKNFFVLGLKGGLLRQNGKVVAYTIGEAVGNSTFAVHFEKAFSEIQGAYPAINQLFLKAETKGFRYINREEDVGAEGLRKAKLSYYPAFLLEKYVAEAVV